MDLYSLLWLILTIVIALIVIIVIIVIMIGPRPPKLPRVEQQLPLTFNLRDFLTGFATVLAPTTLSDDRPPPSALSYRVDGEGRTDPVSI